MNLKLKTLIEKFSSTDLSKENNRSYNSTELRYCPSINLPLRTSLYQDKYLVEANRKYDKLWASLVEPNPNSILNSEESCFSALKLVDQYSYVHCFRSNGSILNEELHSCIKGLEKSIRNVKIKVLSDPFSKILKLRVSPLFEFPLLRKSNNLFDTKFKQSSSFILDNSLKLEGLQAKFSSLFDQMFTGKPDLDQYKEDFWAIILNKIINELVEHIFKVQRGPEIGIQKIIKHSLFCNRREGFYLKKHFIDHLYRMAKGRIIYKAMKVGSLYPIVAIKIFLCKLFSSNILMIFPSTVLY